jgi:hypothetical protein
MLKDKMGSKRRVRDRKKDKNWTYGQMEKIVSDSMT